MCIENVDYRKFRFSPLSFQPDGEHPVSLKSLFLKQCLVPRLPPQNTRNSRFTIRVKNTIENRRFRVFLLVFFIINKISKTWNIENPVFRLGDQAITPVGSTAKLPGVVSWPSWCKTGFSMFDRRPNTGKTEKTEKTGTFGI